MAKKVFAVIDTNVIVSGFLTKNPLSPTQKILSALTEGLITPLFNKEIIEEYKDVLQRDKFKLPMEQVGWILKLIETDGIGSERINTELSFPDPKDVVFYEIAMSKEDAYLVTGNIKHFPKKPFVVTPAEMVEILGI